VRSRYLQPCNGVPGGLGEHLVAVCAGCSADMFGLGTLSLPADFARLGWVPGLICLVWFAAAGVYSGLLYQVCATQGSFDTAAGKHLADQLAKVMNTSCECSCVHIAAAAPCAWLVCREVRAAAFESGLLPALLPACVLFCAPVTAAVDAACTTCCCV
jgi:hypothetical protein